MAIPRVKNPQCSAQNGMILRLCTWKGRFEYGPSGPWLFLAIVLPKARRAIREEAALRFATVTALRCATRDAAVRAEEIIKLGREEEERAPVAKRLFNWYLSTRKSRDRMEPLKEIFHSLLISNTQLSLLPN